MNKLLAACGLATAALLASAPASAIDVTISPSAQHIDVGGTATVTVSISGLGNEILSAFDLNMVYDGEILQLASANGDGAFGARHLPAPRGEGDPAGAETLRRRRADRASPVPH